MPCRCDGYEVSAADVRAEMDKKVEHLEGQLCNAQSLLHKILETPMRPGAFVTVADIVAPELKERAAKHIAVLVAHKRTEHEADTAKMKERLAALKAAHDRELVIQGEAMDRAVKLAREAAEVSRAITLQEMPTDKALLG